MTRAFIVYSWNFHVPYMNQVLSIVKEVLKEFDIEPIELTTGAIGAPYIHEQLKKNISKSDFGIVILDGLRPNVVYELAMLQTLKNEVIALQKNDAKISIKSFYFNQQKGIIDSESAFKGWEHHEEAFGYLEEPLLKINDHLSDLQGLLITPFTTIDISNEKNSLGFVLNERLSVIVPRLRLEEGPNFDELYLSFPEIPQNQLDESVIVLSLFSVIGWFRNYKSDKTFETLRENYRKVFKNRRISLNRLDEIYDIILSRGEEFIKKFGRYISVNSKPLIRESFKRSIEDKSFFGYYCQIMTSSESELKKRFLERIHTSGILNDNMVQRIGSYLFSNNYFPDISVLQDKVTCELFVLSAELNPSFAYSLLKSWFDILNPMEVTQKFPFIINMMDPGNPEEPLLWFLAKYAKNTVFFNQSMAILKKFSISVIVNQEKEKGSVYESNRRVALQLYLEQCHPFVGQISIKNRWSLIKDINWESSWPEDFKFSTQELMFQSITTFLENNWFVPEINANGEVNIAQFSIPEKVLYNELEMYRKEAYQILIKWFETEGFSTKMFDAVYDYLLMNMSKVVKYIGWDQIQLFLKKVFLTDPLKMRRFRERVSSIKFEDENFEYFPKKLQDNLLKLDEELEHSISSEDLIRRNLDISKHNYQLIIKFRDEKQREEYLKKNFDEIKTIIKKSSKSESLRLEQLVIFENFSSSIDFGISYQNDLPINLLIEKIEKTKKIIISTPKSVISEYFLGLLFALFKIDENKWELEIDKIWNESNLQIYRYRILWTSKIISVFQWKKYIQIFNSGETTLKQIFNVLYNRQIPTSVTISNLRQLVIECFVKVGEFISSQDVSLIYYSIEKIWNAHPKVVDKRFSKVFLERMEQFSELLLLKAHNIDLLIEFGKKSPESFKSWLKMGFSLSDIDGNRFLAKFSDSFTNELYPILEMLFHSLKNPESNSDHMLLYSFRAGGDPCIILHFSAEQIRTLYNLDSEIIGHLIGRLLRKVNPKNPFPPIIQEIIITYHDNSEFRSSIFFGFESIIRTFVGTEYDQMFIDDYSRIIQWRDKATDPIFREWLEKFHGLIDEFKKNEISFWQEHEVK